MGSFTLWSGLLVLITSSLLFVVVIGITVVAAAIYLVSLLNRLFTLRNSAEATLAQVKVAMKKRLDLIGQLVETVKGYMRFERETFENIARLRSALFSAGVGGLGEVDRGSRAVLGTILAVAERYPDLKASSTVLNLMEANRSVEDEIARQRYTYNNIVQEFNIMCDTFPSRFLAQALKLAKLEYLRFEEESEKPLRIEVQ